jgi:hypothetical protein
LTASKAREVIMNDYRLPELLRGLGVEPFLNDATTLQRLADVALDLARRAAASRNPDECQRELEVFEWCTQRLALLTEESATTGSRRLH